MAFFVRLAFVLATALPLGCEGHKKEPEPPAEPPRLWDVGLADLMRTGPHYVGKQVRVRLPAGSYTVSNPHGPHGVSAVCFPSPITWSPDAIVFECHSPPPNNEQTIIVTGTVDAIVYDGKPRTATVNWQVRVRQCTVIAEPLPPRP